MGNLKSLWRIDHERRRAAGAEFLRHRRCGRAHQSALWPRLLGRRRARAHPARRARCDAPIRSERAIIVERETRAALRPYYDSMVKQDIQSIRRALHERDPDYKPRLKARIMKSFIEDAVTPATRGDLAVLSASSRRFPHVRRSRRVAEESRHPRAHSEDVGDAARPSNAREPLSAEPRPQTRRNAGPARPRRLNDKKYTEEKMTAFPQARDGQDQRHRHGRL